MSFAYFPEEACVKKKAVSDVEMVSASSELSAFRLEVGGVGSAEGGENFDFELVFSCAFS